MTDEFLLYIQKGLNCKNEGKLEEAEEWLTRGIYIIKALLADRSLSDSQSSTLGKHLQDAANYIKNIRSIMDQKKQEEGGKKKEESKEQQLAVVPSPTTTPNLASVPLAIREQKNWAKKVQPHLSANFFLDNYSFSRAPGFVLNGIDIATSLMSQKRYKEAVDVLQHVYDLGLQESKLPANFHKITSCLLLMRRNYYSHVKPRFLQDNPVLPVEMSLLRRSGKTDAFFLPIWDDLKEGYATENVFVPCKGCWVDPSSPKLSSTQLAKGAEYMRITDIRPKTNLCIINKADPLNIKQTVVGDCSMVCSLIICASYQQRFSNVKIISNVIYPQDSNGVPIINPKGKYCVKMLINGITRLVLVDDRFPANPKTGALLCTYSKDETEIWVSIMEKAFVKVCGQSYDFPGSNSNSDLYKLSGWLPDVVIFGSDGFDHEQQWNKLYRAHDEGAVLMTLNTSTLSSEEEERLLLVSSHAYAVLKLKEINNLRLLQLKNPWGRRSWRGACSFNDKRKEVVSLLSELHYTDVLADQGIFWITWTDVCRYFARCALSWNPYMLFKTPDGLARKPTRISCHTCFPYTVSTGQMPQFHIGLINTPRPSRMHLVFARHIFNLKEFGASFQENNKDIPFVGLRVYDVTQYPSIAQHLGFSCTFETCYCRRLAHGTELDLSFEPLNDVVYRSASEHTTSFNCPAGTNNLLVVVSCTECEAKKEICFSLTLHTEWPLVKLGGNDQISTGVYMHAIPTSNLKYCSVTNGQWKKGETCGGRSNLQTFVYNPQYLLKLMKPSMFSVRLCVPDCTQSAQVHVVRKKKRSTDELIKWSARVGSFNTESSFFLHAPRYAQGGVVVDTSLRNCFPQGGNEIFDETSKDSRAGRLEMPRLLPAGEYTVVPALWENGVPATFELVVETTEPHELRDVPPEGFGFSETRLYGEFAGGVAAAELHGPIQKSDAYFSSNPKSCFVVASSCLVTCRLLLLSEADANGSVAAKLTLFRSKDASTMENIASSGPYSSQGVALLPIRVDAKETYVLLISSATPSRAKFVLRFYSSCKLNAWMQ